MKVSLRYIAHIIPAGNTYNRNSTLPLTVPPYLKSLFDAGFGEVHIDRKSANGLFITYHNILIVWATKKQSLMEMSTAEAGYVSSATSVPQLNTLNPMYISAGTFPEGL